MTFDEEKKLIIAAISSRSESALAECAKKENSAQLSDALATFIWDSLNLLDLLGNRPRNWKPRYKTKKAVHNGTAEINSRLI